jgi:hypothetical protein
MLTIYMHESFPGEALMIQAIEEAKSWAYEMASPQVFVCWL